MGALGPEVAVDLVRRITAGDARAETSLVELCGPTLRFLTRRFSRDEADAQDLYQETLMLALEKIRRGEVREPEKLAGFLHSVAKNHCTQRYRSHRYTVEQPTAVPPDAPDQQPNPLQGLLQEERIRRTRRLLAELDTPRDREVLFRYYIAEESSTGICANLGLTSDHFYRVLHRARQRYRRLWRKQRASEDVP